MKKKVHQKIDSEKQKIKTRLKNALKCDGEKPMLEPANIKYEISERNGGIAAGGIGLMHSLVKEIGLAKILNTNVEVLKQHHPYHESDHILNIAYNILCGGKALEDIEYRRNNRVYLDALNTASIPDPTTAGDFCRRFTPCSIDALLESINEARLTVWRQQPASFFQQPARIDADGTLVGTKGECKEGIGLSYNGIWGYHPLVISLGNTGETLYLVNRSGNRVSEDGVIPYYHRAIELCRRGGFKEILLRGDSAFSLTSAFDAWDDQGVRFVFGYDARKNLIGQASNIPEEEYENLVRHAERQLKTQPREKPIRYKNIFIVCRSYKNLRQMKEDVVEFDYQPVKCKKVYRMVAVRKLISVEKGFEKLFDEYRYFFYITNNRELSPTEVVNEAGQRCNQENIIQQQQSGVHALHAPLNTLNANWAYMVIASLAWNLKAWLAMLLPIDNNNKKQHLEERRRLLTMEFHSFLQAIIMIPAQIIHTGRRIIYRILSWNPWQETFFRLVERFQL